MLGYFGLWLHRPQVSPELTMEKSPRMIFLHLFHTVLLSSGFFITTTCEQVAQSCHAAT